MSQKKDETPEIMLIRQLIYLIQNLGPGTDIQHKVMTGLRTYHIVPKEDPLPPKLAEAEKVLLSALSKR